MKLKPYGKSGVIGTKDIQNMKICKLKFYKH